MEVGVRIFHTILNVFAAKLATVLDLHESSIKRDP
jgi:hypothetical protein